MTTLTFPNGSNTQKAGLEPGVDSLVTSDSIVVLTTFEDNNGQPTQLIGVPDQ